MILPLYLLLLIEMSIVSWVDIKTKKISNYWVYLNIVLAIILSIFVKEAQLSIVGIIIPFIFLIIGIVLFSVKIMGAGDSKFLFSLFLLIPYSEQEIVLKDLLISTIAAGLVSLYMQGMKNQKEWKLFFKTWDMTHIPLSKDKKFPFAPVILMTWLLYGYRNYVAL
jgi:prepilin peptidase CpaA